MGMGRAVLVASIVAMVGCDSGTQAPGGQDAGDMARPSRDLSRMTEDMVSDEDMAQVFPWSDLSQSADMAESSDMENSSDLAPTCTPLGNLCDGASTCCQGSCGHISGIIFECCLPAGSVSTDASECCSKARIGNTCG